MHSKWNRLKYSNLHDKSTKSSEKVRMSSIDFGFKDFRIGGVGKNFEQFELNLVICEL